MVWFLVLIVIFLLAFAGDQEDQDRRIRDIRRQLDDEDDGRGGDWG